MSTNTKPRLPDRLEATQTLSRGEFLVSPNKEYKLIFEEDGNFALYGEKSGHRWNADSRDSDRVEMQANGCLVATERDGSSVVWSTGTWNQGNDTSVLKVLDNGSAAVFSDGRQIWSTGTASRESPDRLKVGENFFPGEELISPNRKYRMTLQDNGDFVLYEGNSVKWASNTAVDERPARVVVRDDDNLTVIGESDFLWTSGTRRRRNGGSAVLELTDNGDASLKSDGAVIWSTNKALIQPWKQLLEGPVAKGSDRINPGQYLAVGESLISPNQQFTLLLQADGNFVVRRNRIDIVVWTSNTPNNTVTKLAMHWDNDLVLYGTNDAQLWKSRADGIAAKVSWSGAFILFDDGHVNTEAGVLPEDKHLWRDVTYFPVSLGKTDGINEGCRLAIDQELYAGEFQFYFTESAAFVVTDKQDQSTYYYPDRYEEKEVAGAKQILLTSSGKIEFRDNLDRVVYAFGGRAKGKEDGKYRFMLDDFFGRARLEVDGMSRWSTEDLQKSSSPFRPNTSDHALYLGWGIPRGGKPLTSTNGQYRMEFRTSGDLVLFHNEVVLWCSSPWGAGEAYLMYDGNLTTFTGRRYDGGDDRRFRPMAVYWSSNTSDKVNGRWIRFVVRNDGNAVLYAGDEAIWSTNTGWRSQMSST